MALKRNGEDQIGGLDEMYKKDPVLTRLLLAIALQKYGVRYTRNGYFYVEGMEINGDMEALDGFDSVHETELIAELNALCENGESPLDIYLCVEFLSMFDYWPLIEPKGEGYMVHVKKKLRNDKGNHVSNKHINAAPVRNYRMATQSYVEMASRALGEEINEKYNANVKRIAKKLDTKTGSLVKAQAVDETFDGYYYNGS